MFRILILCCLLMFSVNGYSQSPTLSTVLTEMESSIKKLSNYQFEFSSRERFPDGFTEGNGIVQLYFDPLIIRMKQTAPLSETEIIYDTRKNENKLLVKPKALPKGILLSPNAPKIRKQSHHPILDIGFKNVLEFFQHSQTKYRNELEEMTTISTGKTPTGTPCWLLSINFTNQAETKEITLEESTSIDELAKQHHINPYKLLEVNGFRSYKRLPAGTTLKLPLHYAQSIDLYLDKNTFLPITQVIYDEKGLLEQYDYRNIKSGINLE